MANCHPLEVVGRGSETQLQQLASDHLNRITAKDNLLTGLITATIIYWHRLFDLHGPYFQK